MDTSNLQSVNAAKERLHAVLQQAKEDDLSPDETEIEIHFALKDAGIDLVKDPKQQKDGSWDVLCIINGEQHHLVAEAAT